MLPCLPVSTRNSMLSVRGVKPSKAHQNSDMRSMSAQLMTMLQCGVGAVIAVVYPLRHAAPRDVSSRALETRHDRRCSDGGGDGCFGRKRGRSLRAATHDDACCSRCD